MARIDGPPGWVYDLASGLCRGPASYELADKYSAGRMQPVSVNYHGCPELVVLRPNPPDPSSWKEDPSF